MRKGKLLETNMSVNDIYYESVFSSASIFCAAKKSVGVSPTAYKKRCTDINHKNIGLCSVTVIDISFFWGYYKAS